MSPDQLVSFSASIALVMLGLAMLISIVRVIIGPTLSDRILALDVLTVTAMGFVAAIAISTGLMLYLDIAISLALLGFLATVALARYKLSRPKDGDNPP
jgi:multicomponent Na+:H+ antiporter subunit F